MKPVFGLVGLVVVLAIVGILAKTQLKFSSASVAPAAAEAGIKVTEGASTAKAALEIQQQVKDQVNAAMQAAPKPADDK